ncbi:LEAF RUST 10 DISEASE-RESISTANCE LOCUS RECEPTOR-LIKE PROTEIN KINASE-like 1.2 isoform X4 [Phragmites australis]|uniref:LEAF RUST 10 DISEASE-RESISTANCE LOCUS RECEPTOR-LIKE PROTEIN KINASE-like 1.2 isoform X4 n=1 Tax=Phragmites australis TaxID=29695 RepID=UPI002D773A74|nr:LEAF RUST 10 DISEASE-RESISTANCE LOCUS RECEPTOR-LIKE PROTEIN KINASE-like 1.2 isoform X4 [Phragmites australis]
MHACPVPAAAVLCPAMLLLLALLASPTTAVALNTAPSCAPASCGGLAIAYPFWLAGTHRAECGYRAFQVSCDNMGNASLKNSLWTYRILDIFYGNSSFRVTNVELSDGTCNVEMVVNASSDLGLAPFKINPQNQELFFLYNCTWQASKLPLSWAPVSCTNYSSNSFAWLAGMYRSDDILMPLPGNCTVSVMPVLGYEGARGADYQRLMKGGFLLEYKADDCADCTETGGRCRIDVNDDAFECQCSDGVFPVICGSKRTGRKIILIAKIQLTV